MMASKSAFTLLLLLSFASCILQIRGKDLSQNGDNEYKWQGSFLPGQRSSNSSGNSSVLNIGTPSQTNSHFASYSLTETDSALHGVRAKVTLWKIADVQPMSSSSAYIAAHHFGGNGGEMIMAGVHVDPGLYKNYDLRFFTYWNSGMKGCFNVNCPGFVVADGANLYPGQALTPLSTYGGLERYITIRIKKVSRTRKPACFGKLTNTYSAAQKEFCTTTGTRRKWKRYLMQAVQTQKLSHFKDEDTGDWSLYREDQGGPIGGMTLLGWWPKTLFTGLSSHATIVEWTGTVVHPETERSPSMGSGHFSSELNSKAASFKQIFAFNIHGGVIDPEPDAVTPFMDREDCYTVSSLYHSEHSDGSHFFYGGPGGCSEKK